MAPASNRACIAPSWPCLAASCNGLVLDAVKWPHAGEGTRRRQTVPKSLSADWALLLGWKAAQSQSLPVRQGGGGQLRQRQGGVSRHGAATCSSARPPLHPAPRRHERAASPNAPPPCAPRGVLSLLWLGARITSRGARPKRGRGGDRLARREVCQRRRLPRPNERRAACLDCGKRCCQQAARKRGVHQLQARAQFSYSLDEIGEPSDFFFVKIGLIERFTSKIDNRGPPGGYSPLRYK